MFLLEVGAVFTVIIHLESSLDVNTIENSMLLQNTILYYILTTYQGFSVMVKTAIKTFLLDNNYYSIIQIHDEQEYSCHIFGIKSASTLFSFSRNLLTIYHECCNLIGHLLTFL